MLMEKIKKMSMFTSANVVCCDSPSLSAGLPQEGCVFQQSCQHEPGHRVQQGLITERCVVPVCNKRRHSKAICRVAIELISQTSSAISMRS